MVYFAGVGGAGPVFGDPREQLLQDAPPAATSTTTSAEVCTGPRVVKAPLEETGPRRSCRPQTTAAPSGSRHHGYAAKEAVQGPHFAGHPCSKIPLPPAEIPSRCAAAAASFLSVMKLRDHCCFPY